MRGALALLVAVAITSSAPVTYHLQENRISVRPIRERFTPSQIDVLERLNRVDRDHLDRLARIVVPDVWTGDVLSYSVLPRRYPSAESLAKLLVVQQPWQVFGAYERGELVRWGPISSGRAGSPTPTGLFHLNWKSPGRHSSIDPEWYLRWYFNFGNAEGLSFHEYGLPGRPASHSCVRLLAVDAQWLYDWGDQWTLDSARRRIVRPGTPVLIVGVYDFAAAPPWRAPERLGVPIDLPALDVGASPLAGGGHGEVDQVIRRVDVEPDPKVLAALEGVDAHGVRPWAGSLRDVRHR